MEKSFKKHLDKMDKQTKAQETGANSLARDLKRQLDIMDKNMRSQEARNRDITRQNSKLNENLAKEKQNSSALGRELQLCKKDLQKNIATSKTQTNQDQIIQDLKTEIKDQENKSKQASLLCDCLQQEINDFYIYAEYIGENWSSRKIQNLTWAGLYMTLQNV